MFSKWIIFVILVTFAESVPETSPSSEEHDITNAVNEVVLSIIRSFEWRTAYIHVRNNTDNNYTTKVFTHDVESQNALRLFNVTTTFQPSPSLKVQFLFHKNLSAICEMLSVSLNGYVRTTGQLFYTEPLLLNFTLTLPKLQSREDGKKPVEMNYHNFDQYNIKLKNTNTEPYKNYKPAELYMIRENFKTFLKTTLNDKVNTDWKTSLIFLGYTFMHGLGQKATIVNVHGDFIQSEDMHYYFLDTIPSDDFTLSNVTIRGLWNFRGIKLDFGNPAEFPEVQVGDVTGTMERYFPSDAKNSLSLSFNVDTVYISANQEAGRINVKAEGYSVKSTVSNKPLTKDQSKMIIERIESGLANAMWESIKNRIRL